MGSLISNLQLYNQVLTRQYQWFFFLHFICFWVFTNLGNVDSDILSRIPLDMDKYRRDCTEKEPEDVVRVTLDVVGSRQKAIATNTTTPKPTLKDLNLKPFSPKEIREAQESESALHYLLYNKTHGIKLSGSQLKDGHLTVTNLRRQWKKLEVDEHGILR